MFLISLHGSLHVFLSLMWKNPIVFFLCSEAKMRCYGAFFFEKKTSNFFFLAVKAFFFFLALIRKNWSDFSCSEAKARCYGADFFRNLIMRYHTVKRPLKPASNSHFDPLPNPPNLNLEHHQTARKIGRFRCLPKM